MNQSEVKGEIIEISFEKILSFFIEYWKGLVFSGIFRFKVFSNMEKVLIRMRKYKITLGERAAIVSMIDVKRLITEWKQ